ncbi:MAG: hypothetical protein LBL52_00045 [Rickettsiales bacterium]|jgi:hypothetical protein|nr:hypothetical protein [Rickettsiales bacterium]
MVDKKPIEFVVDWHGVVVKNIVKALVAFARERRPDGKGANIPLPFMLGALASYKFGHLSRDQLELFESFFAWGRHLDLAPIAGAEEGLKSLCEMYPGMVSVLSSSSYNAAADKAFKDMVEAKFGEHGLAQVELAPITGSKAPYYQAAKERARQVVAIDDSTRHVKAALESNCLALYIGGKKPPYGSAKFDSLALAVKWLEAFKAKSGRAYGL